MIKTIFFLLVVFSISLFSLYPILDSFAQTIAEDTASNQKIYIVVQSVLRNSEGTLITYLESDKFRFVNHNALAPFLDYEASLGDDPIIIINDKKFQIIKRSQIFKYEVSNVVANTKLSDEVNGNTILLAQFAHDGYPVVPGDELITTWTFIREV